MVGGGGGSGEQDCGDSVPAYHQHVTPCVGSVVARVGRGAGGEGGGGAG